MNMLRVFLEHAKTLGGMLATHLQRIIEFLAHCVSFAAIWYIDGLQNHAFSGIEMVEILKSTLSLPVQFFLKNPPPVKLYFQ